MRLCQSRRSFVFLLVIFRILCYHHGIYMHMDSIKKFFSEKVRKTETSSVK